MPGPESFNENVKSPEREPLFDYTFYDYSNRMEPKVIFSVPARYNSEAFEAFREKTGRDYGTHDTDGFIRHESAVAF